MSLRSAARRGWGGEMWRWWWVVMGGGWWVVGGRGSGSGRDGLVVS